MNLLVCSMPLGECRGLVKGSGWWPDSSLKARSGSRNDRLGAHPSEIDDVILRHWLIPYYVGRPTRRVSASEHTCSPYFCTH